jgi:hypothetical protein
MPQVATRVRALLEGTFDTLAIGNVIVGDDQHYGRSACLLVRARCQQSSYLCWQLH